MVLVLSANTPVVGAAAGELEEEVQPDPEHGWLFLACRPTPILSEVLCQLFGDPLVHPSTLATSAVEIQTSSVV